MSWDWFTSHSSCTTFVKNPLFYKITAVSPEQIQLLYKFMRLLSYLTQSEILKPSNCQPFRGHYHNT